MRHDVILSWQAKEYDFKPKERPWYWAVSIISAGIAAAAFILADYLLSVIAILGGFTVMLVGSKKPRRHTYKLTDKGFMVGEKLIPYRNMISFAIHEDEPRTLNIETNSLTGTVSAPMENIDSRIIEMELKNHNVEEVESLHTFADHLARGIGL